MRAIKALLKDVWNGALPPSEFAGFALWLLGQAFWPLVIFAVVTTILFMAVGR